ncbi:MAG: ankyrin repeat domain-containing protein [Bacteroidia bacterium]
MKALLLVFLSVFSWNVVSAQGCDIFAAIKAAEPTQVQACIDAKADLSATDAKGRTPLIAAVAADGGMVVPERQKKIVQALIAAGADVNATDDRGYAALHYASYQGAYDLIALLLTAKADANLKNPAEESPLLLAARGPLMDDGRLRTFTLLLHAGSDVRLADTAGRTALHLLCAHRARLESPDDADIMVLRLADSLQKHGADLRALDSRGNSSFSNAMQEGHVLTATWLLDKGASALAQPLADYTALHLGTERGDIGMIDRVLKAGIDINRTTNAKHQAQGKSYFFPKGSTPLDQALIAEHECKDPNDAKAWKALGNAIAQRGGISKTFEEYVKGFKAVKGGSRPMPSKIR